MMIQLPYVTWDGQAHTRDQTQFVDTMVKHYITAALWSSGDGDLENLDEKYDIDDLSPESFECALFDCTAFLRLAKWHIHDWTPEQLGHDFWLTRNHHGAGFWDRVWGTKADRDKLTELSHVFGEINPYVGDDGKVWIH